MKLYFAPRTRSVPPRWLLEELGVSYELVRVDLEKGEHKRPGYLAINPNGHVPSLIDGPIVLFESGAITTYIADKHLEGGLAPRLGSPERAFYYQWIFFAAATLERHVKQYCLHAGTLPANERSPTLAAVSKGELLTCASVISDQLEHQPYLLRSGFSAADILIYHWLSTMKTEIGLLDDFDVVRSYVEALETRPARARALA